MAENDFTQPHLTRKEARLIKLFRMQSEEFQREIEDRINRLHEEQKKINQRDALDDKDEDEAFWLNSEYYKK